MSSPCEFGNRAIPPLTPYSAYRDSGVEWLGEVPDHWEVQRLKTALQNVVEGVAKQQSVGPVLALENVESWTGHITLADADSAYDSQLKRFRAGDVLFGKLRPYLAKVARLRTDGSCVGEFLVLRPRGRNFMGAHVEHLLRSKPFIEAVNRSTFGARMPRADWRFMGGMPIVRPPLSEQESIVRFLNHADRRMRRAIRAKEKRIALLEEQKQALIQEAVTGQIDVRTGKPYPAYEDSGVSWIGDIPAHWPIVRLGRLFRLRQERGSVDLPILEVSLKTGVRVRSFSGAHRKQVMDDRAGYQRAIRGDIAYNVMRMWQGAVGVVPEDGLVSPAYVVAEPTSIAEARYFRGVFRTAGFRRGINMNSRGIVKDRNRLYWQDFKQLPAPTPPYDEQHSIAEHLEEATVKTLAAVEGARRQVELTREYRARLIADVVTGKLDVREAAASLPDADPPATDEHDRAAAGPQANPTGASSA